ERPRVCREPKHRDRLSVRRGRHDATETAGAGTDRSQTDVALANSPSPAIAIKSVAPNLPIVCPQISDFLVPSLVANYARPGGSATGMAFTVEGVATKLLELALDAVPGSTRIGFLANPAGASMALWVEQVETAARVRGVTLLIQEAHAPNDLTPAFDGLAKQRSQAVIVPANGLFQTERSRIIQLALAARLPTIMAFPHDVEVGALAIYGVDARENYRRAAAYVDKILKGAKPGDLPIEFPTKLMLAINLKTARALGSATAAWPLAAQDLVLGWWSIGSGGIGFNEQIFSSDKHVPGRGQSD